MSAVGPIVAIVTDSLVTPDTLAEPLASFTRAEDAQVYARDTRTGQIVFCADNQVTDEYRTLVREHFACLIPGCANPGLTAHHRASKRDGFAHLSTPTGVDHSGERLFHIQAKAMLVAWVSERFPTLTAVDEVSLPEAGRQADVLVTWPTGERVAFEVQYHALSIGDWQRRHDTYRAAGIKAVWLFGHHGDHMKPAGPAGATVNLSELHRKVNETEGPGALLWVNPTERLIGLPHTTRDFEGIAFETTTTADDTWAQFQVEPLDECDLDPERGLIVPAVTRLRDGLKGFLAAKAAAAETRRARDQRLREKAAAAKAAARQLKPAPTPHLVASSTGARRPLAPVKPLVDQAEPWETSSIKAALDKALAGDPYPVCFDAENPDPDAFAVPAFQWRAAVYLKYILAPQGRTPPPAYYLAGAPCRVIVPADVAMTLQEQALAKPVDLYRVIDAITPFLRSIMTTARTP